MSVTLWKPEPDMLIHQALGKLAEECAELSQAVARCLIQGYHEEEPVNHKLNRTQLMEEIADVRAAMRWLFDVLDEPFRGESERERRKFDGFKRWQSMLEADMASSTLLPPMAAEEGGFATPIRDGRDAEIERLREALLEEQTWHEMHDKALSKQPPSRGPNGTMWARAEHQERLQAITAALRGDA